MNGPYWVPFVGESGYGLRVQTKGTDMHTDVIIGVVGFGTCLILLVWTMWDLIPKSPEESEK